MDFFNDISRRSAWLDVSELVFTALCICHDCVIYLYCNNWPVTKFYIFKSSKASTALKYLCTFSFVLIIFFCVQQRLLVVGLSLHTKKFFLMKNTFKIFIIIKFYRLSKKLLTWLILLQIILQKNILGMVYKV